MINNTMIHSRICRGLLSSLAVVTVTTGIAQGAFAQQPTQLSYQSSTVATHGYSDYMLGAGDQITLSVVGSPEFDNGYVVLPDGNIVLPLIGPVSAAGKTLTQLNQELTTRLQYYFIDPVVNSRLSILRPVTVNMTGEVHRAGPVQLTGITSTNANSSQDFSRNFTEGLPTLGSALSQAGGVTPDADIRDVMIRRQVPGGQYRDIRVNLWNVIQAQGNGASFILRDGDTVSIARLQGDEIDQRLIADSTFAPAQIRVRVVGQVVTPGEVLVPPDSTVSSAVAAAGGPANDAHLGDVALVRLDESGEINEQSIDMTNMIENNAIQDGDVIVVGKRDYLSLFDNLGRILNPFNFLGIFGF